MNNIGFGILCFGDEYYYAGTIDKINNFIEQGFHCYVLTDDVEFFDKRYNNPLVHLISYDRSLKSYHDKIILTKYILKNHNICILMDADAIIKDYSFLDVLRDYNFSEGVSYINVLKNHLINKKYVNELNLYDDDWSKYREYCENICPEFINFELIWEYFLVFNKNGFHYQFYNWYEKLQVKKESSDIELNKDVNGAGEGVSISIASLLSKTHIQRDIVLYEEMKGKILSIGRQFTPEHLLPKLPL